MKMKILVLTSWLALVGCQNEPMTLREQAEQAQENLQDAREQATEVIAESEEQAVDIVADARADAQQKMQQGKRQAADIIADAKSELTEKLDELSASQNLQPKPDDDAETP